MLQSSPLTLLFFLQLLASHPGTWTATHHICYCIGSPPNPNTAMRFTMIVVDPDETSRSLLEEYKARGVKVLAYLNTGYAEDWRDYWNNTRLKEIIHGETEYEGEYFVEYWSPVWRNIMVNHTLEYLRMGYDGVFLDNIDAYIVLNESNESWVQGIDLRASMISLIETISLAARNATSGSGSIYVNIGGALEDLDGGLDISNYINGYVREEVLFYSFSKCTNNRAQKWEWLREERYLIKGVSSGLDVNVVEFVSSYEEAIYSLMVHARWGIHVTLQPACDPYYMHPPIIIGANPSLIE